MGSRVSVLDRRRTIRNAQMDPGRTQHRCTLLATTGEAWRHLSTSARLALQPPEVVVFRPRGMESLLSSHLAQTTTLSLFSQILDSTRLFLIQMAAPIRNGVLPFKANPYNC
jgi:hypothetical protein